MNKIIKIFIILYCFGQIVSGQSQSTNIMNPRANLLVENDSLLIMSINEKIFKIKNDIAKLDSNLISISKIKKESRFVLYIVQILSIFITALLTYVISLKIYLRQEKFTKKKQMEVSKSLLNALFEEVQQAIEKSCSLVELNAVWKISRASLPQSARTHLMSAYSELSLDSNVLICLTNIYNCLDRIKIHQDSAVNFDINNDITNAFKEQSIAASFVKDNLEYMIKNLQNIGKNISDILIKRIELIRISPSNYSYSVLAFIFILDNNKEFNKEVLYSNCKTVLLKYGIQTQRIIETTIEEVKRTYLEDVGDYKYRIKNSVLQLLNNTYWINIHLLNGKLEYVI